MKKVMISESPHLFVICDGNSEVGYGHFFRCLHLLKALKASLPALKLTWMGAIDESLLTQITVNALTEQFILVDSANDALRQILLSNRSWVLSDSYLLSERDLDTLADQHHLIAIDDFGKHSHAKAQAVLNFCVSATQYRYKATEQLLGTGYFLTDPRLNPVREYKLSIQASSKVPLQILIAMGGFDRFDVGAKIALAISESKLNTNITLLGASEQILPNSINHLTSSKDMARLYRQSDLVISGGGLIKYESAYCAIFNIAVSQTPEQLAESEAFAAHNLCLSYGLAQDWHKESFITWFEALDLTAQCAQVKTASANEFATNSTEKAAKALAILIDKSAR